MVLHLPPLTSTLQEAEKHITGMEKWCGLCVVPWYRRKKIKVCSLVPSLA